MHKRIDEMFTFIYVQRERVEERREMFHDKSKETFRVQSSEWMQFTMRRGTGGKEKLECKQARRVRTNRKGL